MPTLPRILRKAPLLAALSAVACTQDAVDVELPLLQTGQGVYTLHASGERLATEIDYRFENRTHGVVLIENCMGAFGVSLDRREADGWVTAWSSVIAACQSEPIRVGSGEVYDGRLRVSGAAPGSPRDPRFDTTELSGTYRLRWSDGTVQALPERYRVSNSFEVIAPAFPLGVAERPSSSPESGR